MTSDHPLVVPFSDAARAVDVVYVNLSADDGVASTVIALGWILRRVREARGLTLNEVAQQCELNTSTLCRLEQSKRNIQLRQALRLCNALNIRLSDALRMAEDEAFPLGRSESIDHPAAVAAHPSGAAGRRAILRGGEHAPRQSR